CVSGALPAVDKRKGLSRREITHKLERLAPKGRIKINASLCFYIDNLPEFVFSRVTHGIFKPEDRPGEDGSGDNLITSFNLFQRFGNRRDLRNVRLNVGRARRQPGETRDFLLEFGGRLRRATEPYHLGLVLLYQVPGDAHADGAAPSEDDVN